MSALDEDSHTPFLTAAYHGQVDALRFLLESGAPVDALDKNRKSCVFLAAKHNYTAILEVCLQNDNETCISQWYGLSIYACTCTDLYIPGITYILQVLVQNPYGRKLCRGADVNLNTPLHYAAKFGHLSAAKVIDVVNKIDYQCIVEFLLCD